MYKRYFRKKDPFCKTKGMEWVEMSGREYYSFVTDPENKGRWFVDMGDVVLECTEEEYKRYKAEDDHSSYIREQQDDWRTHSLESIAREVGLCSEELIADITQDVETEVIRNLLRQDLYEALQTLSPNDYWVIRELFLSKSKKTIRKLSAENKIPVMTLQDRKRKILTILRKKMLSKKVL